MTFLDHESNFLSTRNTLFMSVLTYKHQKRHNKTSWQFTATSFRWGIVYPVYSSHSVTVKMIRINGASVKLRAK